MINEIIEKVQLHKNRAKSALLEIKDWENILNNIIDYKNKKNLK